MQGDELRSIRKALGLNAERLGKVLGLTRDFIYMMENGKKPIEPRTAFSMLYLAEHPEAVQAKRI